MGTPAISTPPFDTHNRSRTQRDRLPQAHFNLSARDIRIVLPEIGLRKIHARDFSYYMPGIHHLVAPMIRSDEHGLRKGLLSLFANRCKTICLVPTYTRVSRKGLRGHGRRSTEGNGRLL